MASKDLRSLSLESEKLVISNDEGYADVIKLITWDEAGILNDLEGS